MEGYSMDDKHRSKTLDRIRKTLIEYAKTVEKNVSSGRTDIVKDAENFFLDLFNLMYGYDLLLANQIASNHPAVDLIDKEHGVAVQITSNNTRQKVKHTVDSFCRYNLEKTYPTLIFLILSFAPPFRNAERLVHEAQDQNIDLRILTLVDIFLEIQGKPSEQIQEIAKCLDKHIGLVITEDTEAGINFIAPSAKPVDLPNVCQQVFRLASMLPAEGLRRTVFEYGLSPEQRKALVDLIDCNLIHQEDEKLFVHPDYRDDKQLIPSLDECSFFLEQLWHYEKSWKWDDVLWRNKCEVRKSLAQIYATAAEYFPDDAVTYAQHSAELWRNENNYAQALDLGQQALTLLESKNQQPWEIARARHFAGECHAVLQNHDLALKDWQITLELCQNQLHASTPDLVEALHNVGKALIELKKYDDAEPHLLFALKMLEHLREKFKHFPYLPRINALYDSLATLYTGINATATAHKCIENTLHSPKSQKSLSDELYSARDNRLAQILILNLPLRTAMDESSFVGREQELEEIAARFETERIVVLSGLGGMGKTELAIYFAHKRWRGNSYFVRFRKDFFHTIVDEIAFGIPGYSRESKSEQQIFAETMAALSRCSKNDLLIIDNADEVNFSALRRELSKLPLRVLVTTRQDVPNAVAVRVLERDALYKVFRNQDADILREDMDALITAVEGHTLTVDMMARTMRPGRRSATAKQLLAALHGHNLSGSFTRDEIDYTGSRRINEHLRVVFRVAELTEDEQQLLRYATLLPPEGIDDGLFLSVFDEPGEKVNVLDKLIDTGWLLQEEGLLKIHPVIRIVCLEDLRPTGESCEAFLEAVRAQYDPMRYDLTRYTQMAALFTEASTILEDQNGYWANVAGHLWNELSEPQKALDCNLRSVVKSEVHQPDSANLASAYSNTGYTYSILGDYGRALEYKLKALAIRERVFPPDHPDLAITYDSTGSTYSELGDHEKALEYKLKALAIREKILSGDHPDLARSYNNVGMTYGNLGDHHKALEYLRKALEIRERVLPGDHPNLALSYNNVGYAYGNLGDHRKALEYKLRALEIRKRVLSPDHPDLAASYNNVGSTYSDLGDYGKALEYQLKALSIQETALPPEHPVFVQSYGSIGNIYSDIGDHEKALQYYLKAMKTAEKALPAEHPTVAYTYINVGHAYGDLGDYPRALEYLEKALAIAEKALPQKHSLLKNIRDTIKQYRMMRNMLAHGFDFDNPNASKFEPK